MNAERFVPDRLVEQACEQAGSDDFGDDDTWRDGLARLCDGLVSEARLNDLGVEIAVLDLIRPLTSRLQIIKWRKENPAVAAQPITRPIFIVGQPRTGTTILFDLLAQDPALRPPLTWEVDNPYPLPRPETYDTDPRIAETQASIEMSEQIVPGLLTLHPMGALVGQECVRITAGQFCSMIFSVQYRLPSYYRWLLYDADHQPAYRYHRMFLQHLQSGVPRSVAAEVARTSVAARRAGGRVPRRADRADAPRPAQRHLVDQRAHPPSAPTWRPTTARSPSAPPSPARRSSSASSAA